VPLGERPGTGPMAHRRHPRSSRACP
jgi:hypothetical protein